MQYINGAWVEKGSHRFQSLNPATGQPIWEGWAASDAEVKAAVAAAHAAFPAWAALGYSERYAVIKRFKEIVEAKKEDIALLIAQETGKALWDARSEAAAVISKLGFADEAYHERTGRKARDMPGGKAVVTHRPHGVMAVYGPYNFPAHLPNGHITPALLAGNTVVFKPSEQTPMVAEWVVKCWAEAGLSLGILNLVQGERDTGIALARADIQGLLFTGSTATGKALHAQFAGRPEVILALEMGGNNALLVAETANLDAAVHETLLSAFTGSGQRCTCARRLIVLPWANSEAFIDQLVAAASKLVVGGYDSTPSPFMGPLISIKEAARLIKAQTDLESLGGRVLLRMTQPKNDLPFVTPGIIDMTGVAHIPDEEFFGPLLQLHRAKDDAEAIAIANQTSFGLSASVICDAPAQYQTLSQGIRAGLINWNRQTTGASGAGPFGGIGVSGNHRPAGYYSADYCAYPVAAVEVEALTLPEQLPPGFSVS